ncbi:hypothetical protein M1439_01485 [Candidatus Marsarchaeota archaeon]|jgi:hypothetical protein|nr:hypothetical protein [Candidatus Marsarchaeota archaeon]MCL5092537.1 hypothetical protein [Candidatus Marsarchaeota archaeon]
MKFFDGVLMGMAMTATHKYFRMLMLLAAIGSFATIISSASLTSNVIAPICTVYNAVHTAIFILGLTLMILGGALYAGSHMMPGSSKGTVQGYGMGMILGGVIGVIIAIASPYILGLLTSNNNITAVCP